MVNKIYHMRKIFVLDTSVLVFDHECIYQFEEHDLVIPISVLEELDKLKKGNDAVHFNARELIRKLARLADETFLDNWVPIAQGKGKIKIYNETGRQLEKNAESIFGVNKNDHRILNTAMLLQQEEKQSKVYLVTKDINLRLKGKSIGIEAQDYLSGQVKDTDTIAKNHIEVDNLSSDLIQKIFQYRSVPEDGLLGLNKLANG